MPYRSTRLYRANVTMLLLCAFSGFYLLVSPLVPYTFDLNTINGLAVFIGVHQTLTVVLGAIGIKLNILADRDVVITADSFRRLMRRR
jgi:hypothetical protein